MIYTHHCCDNDSKKTTTWTQHSYDNGSKKNNDLDTSLL